MCRTWHDFRMVMYTSLFFRKFKFLFVIWKKHTNGLWRYNESIIWLNIIKFCISIKWYNNNKKTRREKTLLWFKKNCEQKRNLESTIYIAVQTTKIEHWDTFLEFSHKFLNKRFYLTWRNFSRSYLCRWRKIGWK